MLRPKSNIFIREERLIHRVNFLIEYMNDAPNFETDSLMNEIVEFMEELIQIDLVRTNDHDFEFLDAIEFQIFVD